MKSRNKQIAHWITTANADPLIIANDKQNFIQYTGNQAPAKLSRQSYWQQTPVTVIDKESLKLIQVLRLHKIIDHTLSATGSATLLRSLIQPSTNLHYIRSKQASLREIAANDKLRRSLTDGMHEFRKGESALYKFFNKGLYAMLPYGDLKRARKSAANLSKVVPAIPSAESSYLSNLIAHLHAYQGSAIDQMMQGPIYKTFSGLKSEQEAGVFTPKLKFVPHHFSKWGLAGPTVVVTPYISAYAGFEQLVSPALVGIGLVWTALYSLYGLGIKPVKDTGNFIEPLRAKCIDNTQFSRAVDAIGMIDALLACHRFAAESTHATTLPKVTDEGHHFFEATGLRNPVLAGDKPEFVPNNVRMNGARLTFISGPNSGGKTTICKSIVQNQLLAQMGSYVLAEKAAINIADMISYQAPKFDGLHDAEGRFGTELIRTRDIFYSTSPKSLVVLDELAEGTTYEERLHESFGILSDFHTIGNNTVLVTHNHSLVDRFMHEEKGQSLMLEFEGDDPTYKIKRGISRVSHADRIAKKIRFSGEDRRRYLKAKGFA